MNLKFVLTLNLGKKNLVNLVNFSKKNSLACPDLTIKVKLNIYYI